VALVFVLRVRAENGREENLIVCVIATSGGGANMNSVEDLDVSNWRMNRL